MLSLFLGALGIGAVGVGLGLLVQGPLALDRRTHRTRSDSAWVSGTETLDLHADRRLGSLDGASDELWRPVVAIHFWTIGACGFGAAGVGLTAAGVHGAGAVGAAAAAGLIVGYAAARGLRRLPPRADS